MADQTTTSIRLTDKPAIQIVEEHQRKIGDLSKGRTLSRIVQAFHSAGLSLTPERDIARTPENAA